MRVSVPIGASILFLSITPLALAADDPLMKQAQGLFQPIPLEPPVIKGTTATPAMVELGKDLYFDPRLSQSHNISCNTCHQIGLGGVDMLSTSIGHKWQKGGRNAPTVLNAVFNVAQFWDGRAADLKAQAGGPIQNPIEMGITHEHAVVERPGADILPPNDKGRFAVTKTVSDQYVFRVPPLRNVELTPPYFHSGQVWDLTQAVGIMATDQLGKSLNEEQAAKIATFLKSLTGDQPQVVYPILPPSVATTPTPQP